MVERIFKQKITLIIYKDITLESAIGIFNRINTAGMRLKTVSIFAALTRTDQLNFYVWVKALREKLEPLGFACMQDKVFKNMLTVIAYKSADNNKSRLFYNDIKKLITTFDLMEAALIKSIGFLNRTLGIQFYKEVPYEFHIIALTYFFTEVTNVSAKQADILKVWIFKSAFMFRYQGANYTLWKKEIKVIDRLIYSEDDALLNFSWDLTTEDLIKSRGFNSSARSKALTLILKSLEPRSVETGIRILGTRDASVLDNIETHHFFSLNYFKVFGHQPYEASLVNMVMVRKGDNIALGPKAPSINMPEIKSSLGSKYQVVMKSLVLDIDESVFADDDYERFLEYRSEKLLELIEAAVMEKVRMKNNLK